MQAFGNAKTVRNDNSSRFGKYMEIQFDATGAPIGGKISQYLLEKSRVVTRAENERSFHIFYQLLSQKDLLGDLGLSEEHKNYKYLNLSKCFKVPYMRDDKEFNDVVVAMDSLNFDKDAQRSVWKILAAILHLGNVELKDKGKGQSEVSNKAELAKVAKVLAIDVEVLEKALCSHVIQTIGQRTEVFLDAKGASFARDSFAKALYDKVFDWVVAHINTSIQCKGRPEMVIGVLDIYGFEIFEKNSFEQFCINFCNEKLQQLFIRLVLQQEQAEYKREGIKWTNIDFFDNAPIVALMEGLCLRFLTFTATTTTNVFHF
jgi:myosin-1